ncbi:MAG TPA: DNA-directed RNA polymerase subunit omega [Epsilonproteobacteria bacterium]|nr:DNA-directed RNA polymerase subunit omega [Campylobacterota bacterium]
MIMTRTEEITAKALERLNHDKYLLASAVGKRAEAISNGAIPEINMDVKVYKATDIALREIAEGKIAVHLEE